MARKKLDDKKFRRFGKLALTQRRCDFYATWWFDRDGEPTGEMGLFAVDSATIPGILPQIHEVVFRPVSRKLAKALVKGGVPAKWLVGKP